jgi:hypothetical protein
MLPSMVRLKYPFPKAVALNFIPFPLNSNLFELSSEAFTSALLLLNPQNFDQFKL